MKDTRIEELASNLLNNSIQLKEKEDVLIEIIGEEGMPLAKEIIKQAEEIKARPYFKIVNNEILRTMLENATEEQIKLYAQHDWNRMKDMDAYIGIRDTSNTAELNGIPSEKLEMYNKYYTFPVHYEERPKNTRWCILRYINKSMAQMSNMNTDEMVQI